MCSLNDVDGNSENLVVIEKPSFGENMTCRGCTNRGLVVLRKKDVYCKDCFLATETHKFRAALGKSKMMKPQDKVLVAYSGSQSSAALLHLLHSGVTEEQHKKLLFSVFVLFIDEGALFNLEIDERNKIVNNIKNELSAYNFPIFISSLSEYYKDSPVLDSTLKVDEEYDRQLVDLFGNVKSLTSKQDLLYTMRQQLIVKVAEQLNCNKVFTAEVGTDIAVKLLSVFSLGRGGTASFETGFCDSRHPHINILRPLRDFTKKEIIFYNKFHNIEAINIVSLTTKLPSNVSIQKLTEKFVTNLQEEFPSTVYTIFRTGEKLSSSTFDEEDNDVICVLCKDKVRTHKGRSSYTATEAASFSRSVSRKKANNYAVKEKGSCCGSCSSERKPEIDELEVDKFFCYGCALIVRDMKNINLLPKDVIQSVLQKKNFEAMKEQISEFLIENSSEVEVPLDKLQRYKLFLICEHMEEQRIALLHFVSLKIYKYSLQNCFVYNEGLTCAPTTHKWQPPQ